MTDSERILGFDRPPILLVGSGLTRRYAEGAPDWLGLLRTIAGRIGLDEARFIAFEEEARNLAGPDAGHLPRLASLLEEHIIGEVKAGRADMRRILDDREHAEYMRLRGGAVRIMAASALSALTLSRDPGLQAEIGLLRQLPHVIPCVITTNYDTLLDDQIFGGRFKVYSRVSDYYLSGAQGIGEIYKIHGTCTDPSTMILNERDYRRLLEDSRILVAKILSVLCDYPMVIVGYSLDDPDVKGILSDLVASLEEDKLRQVERSIVYVYHTPGLRGFVRAKYVVEHQGRRMEIGAVATDDFEALFGEIAGMRASLSPSLIRKVRQLVRRIVVDESSGESCALLGIDDDDLENTDKMAIALTSQENLRALRSIPIYNVDAMVRDIMCGGSEFEPRAVVEYFLKAGKSVFNRNQYVPVFHFMRESGCEVDTRSGFMGEFVHTKSQQFEYRLNDISLQCAGISSYGELQAAIGGRLSAYQVPLAVMHCFDAGIITEEEAMGELRKMYEQSVMESNARSYFLCALTFVSFKQLGLRNDKGGQ